MAQYGIDNFLYEVSVSNGSAVFKFHDPQDLGNTAEVTVHQKDFPEGITDADSRQVADLAYNQCRGAMNDVRSKRIAEAEAKQAAETKAAEVASRHAADEHHANSQELANTTPTGSPSEAVSEETPAPASKSIFRKK